MLMFQNALMYNNCEHDVYKMTEEMQKDVMDQVGVSIHLVSTNLDALSRVSSSNLFYQHLLKANVVGAGKSLRRDSSDKQIHLK